MSDDRPGDWGFAGDPAVAQGGAPATSVVMPPAGTAAPPAGAGSDEAPAGNVNVWAVGTTPKQRPAASETEERRDRNVLWLGATACTVGLCLLLFVGYVFVFSGFIQARKQVTLNAEFRSTSARAALAGAVPADGSPVGILTIPALRLKQVVVEGTTATDLLNGPGVMTGTARPGTAGNTVLAGRRTVAGGPFRNIGTLRHGDRILVTTGLGVFSYRVTLVSTASIGAVDPVSATRRAQMTLITSDPPVFPKDRLYVVARMVTAPATGPHTSLPRHEPTASQLALGGDPAAVWPSIIWGLVVVAALGACMRAYQRRRNQIWVIYLLTTPIVLALALVWYSNLIRLLPATM
jgi:sortase A